MNRRKKRLKQMITGLFITLVITISGGCSQQLTDWLDGVTDSHSLTRDVANVEEFPAFDGENAVLSVNENRPTFTEEQLTIDQGTWQAFSNLDSLNRVGEANALLHKNMMPTEERGDIQNVYPTGWHQKKIGDKWLYNRSHVIGHQLTGEDDNWQNLFTGTEQMNQGAMVEYEKKVADYLRSTDNHVRYRVTPTFYGEELVCRGVQMEAQSIEDDQLSFNIFIYNIEDGVSIDYATGQSTLQK
ncbi:DNA/RNA non-specific endonuclease [Enterococcus sp. AZ196]|uniref:DNA/RNA non-specific endonuclease n=1 Tax=Enterococcus sp. AZ196 TaxID=2774659 RepID=UPI003D2E0B23